MMAFDTHGASGRPWTGFDLDGTLATYDKWRGVAHIGDPVKPMCDLIKKLHSDGKDVKIVTARVAPREDGSHLLARAFIARWCKDKLGFIPPITNEKDALMETLYDDRVHAVEQNTGKVINMTIEFKDMSGKTIHTGDTVEWFRNTYKVKGLSRRGMGGTSYDTALLVEIGSGRTIEKPTHELRLANSRSRNAVVANAMAANAKDAEGNIIRKGDTVIFADEEDEDNPREYEVQIVKGDYVYLGNGMRDVYGQDLLVYNSKKSKRARNAVARNANGLDGLIADLDSGKYDSVNWMPKVIGPGTLYPDGMKFPTGLGYDDEEKVRAAWKSGKYASVVLYKGGSKRGEIPVNAVKTTNAVVAKALNSVRNSVFQTETELERAIGAKLGKSVDVGIDGNAVSIGLESKGDVEKAVAVVKEKLGDIVSYKYMGGSDPWLQVTLKTSVPNAATKDAVAREALNYSPYHKGRWLHDHKSGRNFTVVKEEHWGKDSRGKDGSPVECRCVTLRDSTTGRIVELPTTMVDYRFHLGEVEACDVCNSSSVRTRNAVVQKALNTVAANAWMPLGSTPVSSAKDADGRPIRVGDIVTKTSGSWTEDTVAAIFKEIDGNIAITLKGSPMVVRDPAVEIVKNANSNLNTSQTQGDEMASTNKVIRNAVAAYNYTMIGGRTKPVTRTDGDIEGELMLGWTEIKRRVDFGDESSEREYGQKLKDLFEGKRFAFMDRANARRLEDTLLREWNKLAEFNKLSSL